MIFVGVDPGISGGIAMIYPDGRIGVYPIPTLSKEIDIAKITWIIPENPIVFMEKIWGVSRKLNYVAGEIEGAMKALNVPFYKVAPATWRKEILGNYRAKKIDALNYCAVHHPNLYIGKNHNLAEAVCIAEYGRRKYK